MFFQPLHLYRRALALVLVALLPLASRASDDQARLQAIVDAAIRPLMAQHDIPGMAVAVTVDGTSTVFNYGLASRESQAPVTAATIFELGSISKIYTTTLAALAQESGRLTLNDHPGRHLPQLRGRPIDKATLLHLGTYTPGGLPLQFPDEVKDDAAALAYFQAWKADALPGTVRLYSNPSLALLGAATAAAMQGEFASLVGRHVLAGLGLSHTHYQVPATAMADYAWGYREGRPVRVNPGPMSEPTYGIKATASDLLRLVQAQIDPAALPAALRRAVQATQVGHYRVAGMVQGWGWEQFPWPVSRELLLGGNAREVIFNPNPVQPVSAQADGAPRLYDKTGSTGGFGAYVAFVPARRIGLVMLANRNYPIPARIEAAHAILQQLDGMR